MDYDKFQDGKELVILKHTKFNSLTSEKKIKKNKKKLWVGSGANKEFHHISNSDAL
jgi:hypothetical protein